MFSIRIILICQDSSAALLEFALQHCPNLFQANAAIAQSMTRWRITQFTDCGVNCTNCRKKWRNVTLQNLLISPIYPPFMSSHPPMPGNSFFKWMYEIEMISPLLFAFDFCVIVISAKGREGNIFPLLLKWVLIDCSSRTFRDGSKRRWNQSKPSVWNIS